MKKPRPKVTGATRNAIVVVNTEDRGLCCHVDGKTYAKFLKYAVGRDRRPGGLLKEIVQKLCEHPERVAMVFGEDAPPPIMMPRRRAPVPSFCED